MECSKCKQSSSVGRYKAEFDRLYASWNGKESLSTLEAVVARYKQLLFVDEASSQIDFGFFLRNRFSFGGGLLKFVYLDFVAAVDAWARILVECSSGDAAKARELLRANLANLEFVYEDGAAMPGELKRQTAHVELVHEVFKLAEVECSLGEWRAALGSVERALHIGRNFYADENGTMREMSQMRQELVRMVASL